MTKVNVDSLKPWIAQRITELLGMEDDVVVEFVYNQLEERVWPRDVLSSSCIWLIFRCVF